MATVWPISNGRPKIRSGANTSPGRALVITCGVPSKPRSSRPIGWGAQCYLRHMVGDRSQRRRDVLETSTNLLHEGGWAALTMREVAARTGVSAGALYQWFDGKDEIYAELFTARLNRGIAQFDAMPDGLPFDDIYQDLEDVQAAFRKLVSGMPSDGTFSKQASAPRGSPSSSSISPRL